MSTRGLAGIRLNNNDNLAYNHSDSYPEELGKNFVKDIKTMLVELGLDKIKELAANLNSEPGNYEDFTSIPEILESGKISTHNNFIFDPLFCEWAYIMNLDDNLFEVYSGGNKIPSKENRYSSKAPQGYSACALVKTFPLTEIPKDWIKQLKQKA